MAAATTSSLLQSHPLKFKQYYPLHLSPLSPPRLSKFSGTLTFQGQDFAKFNVRCFFLCEKRRKHLVSLSLNSNDLNLSSDGKNPFGIVAQTVLKALNALKKPAMAAVLLGLLLMFDPNNAALAASGGRMGGRSFSSSSSSSRSYSVPRNGGSSFSSYSVPYYAPPPFGGGGFYVGPAVGVGVGAGSSFFLILMGFAAFVLVSGFLSDRSESSVLTASEKTSVLKLQVGLLGMGRSLQRDLNRIAEVADTSTSEGLSFVLTETTLALLRHPEYCISGYSSVDVKRSIDDGEKRFNQLSIEERGKFDEETLVNVNNIKRQNTRSLKAGGFSNEYIVITILVAAEGVHKLPLINGSADLKEALQKLASIPTPHSLSQNQINMADLQQSDGQLNGVGAPLALASSETVGSKRQRRPSVRLGDIGGDQPYDSHVRRTSSSAAMSAGKQWKNQSHVSLNPSVAAVSTKSSKTRALTNLSTDFNANNETLDDEREANNNNSNLDGVAIGSWRVKDFKKRGPAATKRVRSNWVSKFDDSSGGNININGNNSNTNNNNVETEDKYSGGEDNDGFDMENSESPMKEQSPIHSLDNLGVDGNEREVLYHGNNQRRPIRTRVSDGVELSGPSDTDMRRCEEDGVRIWLNSLGLGRYAPLFEIHEVDDEVLPLLTLEDLKDMGINAVGSRRKMFCAIQKLGKGFS